MVECKFPNIDQAGSNLATASLLLHLLRQIASFLAKAFGLSSRKLYCFFALTTLLRWYVQSTLIKCPLMTLTHEAKIWGAMTMHIFGIGISIDWNVHRVNVLLGLVGSTKFRLFLPICDTKNLHKNKAVVAAQWMRHSLQSPEICGLNPVIQVIMNCIEKRKKLLTPMALRIFQAIWTRVAHLGKFLVSTYNS